MDQFEFKGKKEVKEFLEKNIRFTPDESERIREKVRQKKKNHLRFNPVYWTVLVAAVSLLIILSLSIGSSNNQLSTGNPGLSEPINNESLVTDLYVGEPLEIAIIGELPESNFQNITFESVTPEVLVNSTKEFDAFFVTDQYFEELATDEWTRTFKNINIPIFFLGLDVQAFIFFEDNMNYNDQAHRATSQVQGFVQTTENGDEIMKTWNIGDPAQSTRIDDIADETFTLIFNEIEQFYKVK